MTDRYYVEAWLRPPIEFWSTTACALGVVLLLFRPEVLMLAPSIGLLAAFIPSVLGFWRFRQGLKVIRYQRNLKRQTVYRLRNTKVPVSTRWYFVGRGFEWTQRHTQRLWDTRQSNVARFVRPGRLFRWARRKEVDWEHKFILGLIAALLATRAWWNPLRPYPDVGGDPRIHGVEPNEVQVVLPLADTAGHVLVIGTTGQGKTRLAELMMTQDIHRGDVVIIIDPKGDAELMLRAYAEAKRAGREKDFYLFHLGYPDISCRYNVVGSFDRLTEVPTRIANQLSEAGESAAFKQFAWRFLHIVAQAEHAMGRKPTVERLRQGLENIDVLFVAYCRHWLPTVAPDWEAVVGQLVSQLDERNVPSYLKGRDPQVYGLMQFLNDRNLGNNVISGLRSAVQYDRSYFDKIVSNALPFLDKILAGKLSKVISPVYDVDDRRPLIDWRHIIRTGGIVYMGLDALADPEVAAAVGGIAFSDLASTAAHLYKHGAGVGTPGVAVKPRRIVVHADEFNECIGPTFIPLVNKARGAGVSVVAYTQTLADIEARLGREALARQVVGNFNTLITFRVREKQTADLLCEQLSKVEVKQVMHLSGASDSSTLGDSVHFSSSTQDRAGSRVEALLSPSDIIALPKGQAFLWSNGNLQKLRIPLPDRRGETDAPMDMQAVAQNMAARYWTAEGWAKLAGLGLMPSELDVV